MFFVFPAVPVEAAQIPPPPPVALVAPLRPVCGCESAGDPGAVPVQFNDDGSVLRGRINPDDVGGCQINTAPKNGHVAEAAQLGYDLNTQDGNFAYANYLYKTQGLAPWSASRLCWSK